MQDKLLILNNRRRFEYEKILQTHFIYPDTNIMYIIYLKDGEGEGGNGTLNNPYLNIRTALKNIKDGQTLFLIDTVQYTKYEKGTDGSALPLIINKNITIAGNDTENPFCS